MMDVAKKRDRLVPMQYSGASAEVEQGQPLKISVNSSVGQMNVPLDADARKPEVIFRDPGACPLSDPARCQSQKMIEFRLSQSQKMEALDRLACGIAHDFNNILTAILGYAELAMGELREGTREFSHLQGVYDAGLRARKLIKQILVFGGRADIERKPLQVGPVVSEALRLLRSSLPTTIEIRQHIPEVLDDAIADEAQIRQIVLNLCTNAFEAMPDASGVIEVSLAQIKMAAGDILPHLDLRPGSYLCLKVKDDGCGVAPDVLPFIFDPYFTRNAGKGPGLGLSVVHRSVKSHGGDIDVHSAPEAGSVFDVYLPAIERENMDTDRQTKGPPSISARS